MNDRLAIERAKSEYREGYNHADIERVLSVFAPSFTDFSFGQPAFYGVEARAALRSRLQALFARFDVKLMVSVIAVNVTGDQAFDYGWHQWWLTPKEGGAVLYSKTRYLEIWVRNPESGWKIRWFMTSPDEAPRMEPVPEEIALQAKAGR